MREICNVIKRYDWVIWLSCIVVKYIDKSQVVLEKGVFHLLKLYWVFFE